MKVIWIWTAGHKSLLNSYTAQHTSDAQFIGLFLHSNSVILQQTASRCSLIQLNSDSVRRVSDPTC